MKPKHKKSRVFWHIFVCWFPPQKNGPPTGATQILQFPEVSNRADLSSWATRQRSQENASKVDTELGNIYPPYPP